MSRYRLKRVNAKVWINDNDFKFPEQIDGVYRHGRLNIDEKVGVAFSGGGTRSASATLGQLRGLHHIKVIDKIDYISAVSGGSWAAIPFCYLPDSYSDSTFLGQVVEPSVLTIEDWKYLDKNSFAHVISKSVIADNFLKNAISFAGDETYSRTIGEVFLKPLGLHDLDRFFSLNDVTVSAAIKNNGNMKESDFQVARHNRPFPICGATILRVHLADKDKRNLHFEFTPIYSGCRVLHEGAGSHGADIGGGYVETFGFDSDSPDSMEDSIASVRLGGKRHRITLSDMVGTSGSAPAEVLNKFALSWVGFPDFKCWPLAGNGDKRDRTYEFGDGGNLENLGIMPLLARKVRKIILFVNTMAELKSEKDINDSIPPLFGISNKPKPYLLNQVFETGQYSTLVDGLRAKQKSKKTVMHRDTYTVKENSHFGIDGGWDVDILWIYNENVDEWKQELNPEVKKLIGHGSLGNFPHYRTFFQNAAVIDLNSLQVSALAHLSCWNVIENEDVIKDILG